MLLTVNRNPSIVDLRKFGVTIWVGLTLIGALLWWMGCEPETGLEWSGATSQFVAVVFWGIGIAVAVISFGSPAIGRRVYVGWMLAAAAMGSVMVPVFLTVLFVLFLPVFSLIRFKDPLRLKLKPGESYWEKNSPHEPTIERMMRPF